MQTNDIKFVLMKSLYEKSKGIFCSNYRGMGFSECDVVWIKKLIVGFNIKINIFCLY